jgi:hypothetical protein
VTGNVSAGHSGHAFIVYAHGLNHGRVDQQDFPAANLAKPDLADGHATIDVQHVPMREFRDNVGYASAVGLTLRYHMRDATHGEPSIIEKSDFWNNTKGVDLPYAQNLILRDLRVVRPFSLDEGTGLDGNLVTRNITYENLTVRGYWRGIDLPRSGYSVVRGGEYNNLQNIVVRMAIDAGRSVLVTGDIRFGQFPSEILGAETQYEVFLRPTFEFGGLDIMRAFLKTSVVLNYGRFTNATVYYHTQPADYVPFPAPTGDVPMGFVGLTNQELWSRYRLVVGGRMVPSKAAETRGIFGLVMDHPLTHAARSILLGNPQ